MGRSRVEIPFQFQHKSQTTDKQETEMATAVTGHPRHGISSSSTTASTRLTFVVLSAAPSIPNPIGDRQVYLRGVSGSLSLSL